mmetsp:Transcript_27305/g.86011  ORF Transcript_27305/g.86011 Transcript_27305/m.86011 type:complete len:431 (+) Transcript_27305:2643-3935(+)
MELRNDAATAARRFRVREHGHGSRLHGADGLTPHKIFLLLRVLSGRGLHPLEHAAHEGVELHVGGPCESRKYAEQREERELRVVEVIAAEVRVEERALSSLGVKASQDDEPDDDGAADGTEEAFPVATRQEVRRSYLNGEKHATYGAREGGAHADGAGGGKHLPLERPVGIEVREVGYIRQHHLGEPKGRMHKGPLTPYDHVAAGCKRQPEHLCQYHARREQSRRLLVDVAAENKLGLGDAAASRQRRQVVHHGASKSREESSEACARKDFAGEARHESQEPVVHPVELPDCLVDGIIHGRGHDAEHNNEECRLEARTADTAATELPASAVSRPCAWEFLAEARAGHVFLARHGARLEAVFLLANRGCEPRCLALCGGEDAVRGLGSGRVWVGGMPAGWAYRVLRPDGVSRAAQGAQRIHVCLARAGAPR